MLRIHPGPHSFDRKQELLGGLTELLMVDTLAKKEDIFHGIILMKDILILPNIQKFPQRLSLKLQENIKFVVDVVI
jgi:hypothetical protein